MTETTSFGHAIALQSQVGGHAGVLTTEDGSLIIKPSLPTELAFYALLDKNEQLAPLKPFVPRFMGTIKPSGVVEGSPADTSSIVLQNVSASFKNPNILDVKLGTILYDDNADDVKRERMIKTAKSTTSFETGVRLTGFQVWDPNQKIMINTPKSYGKTITKAQLPEGIAMFFPLTVTPNLGHLAAVIEGILANVEQIKQAIEGIEMRMIAASLLIVWEGDQDALRQCLEDQPAAIGGGEEGDDDDSEADEEDAPRAFAVKVIDFAHARLAPGEGADTGVLLGLDTTINLLKDRLAELRNVMSRT